MSLISVFLYAEFNKIKFLKREMLKMKYNFEGAFCLLIFKHKKNSTLSDATFSSLFVNNFGDPN
jgi:hypothetical protein